MCQNWAARSTRNQLLYYLHTLARQLGTALLWFLETFAAPVFGHILSPTIAVCFDSGSSHFNAIFQYLFAFNVGTQGVST